MCDNNHELLIPETDPVSQPATDETAAEERKPDPPKTTPEPPALRERLAAFWAQITAFAKAHVSWGETLATAVLLCAAVGILVYYIGGPALAYFHADCTDSLLWSQAMVETGDILAEDFHYAALLPFGSPLWMVPILSIFGYTMTAQTVSMSIFAFLFVLAAYSLFRAMNWNGIAAAGSAFVLSMLLSGSVKLREIMWEHVIYYSLGILLFMVLLNLTLRLMTAFQRWSAGEKSTAFYIRFGVLVVLLAVISVGCGTDGFQMLVLTIIPVAGACVAMAVLDGKNRLFSLPSVGKYLLTGVMGAGTGLGLALLFVITKRGQISAGYENAYSNWSAMGEWWGHIEGFLTGYLGLFGVDVQGGEPLFSLSSVFTLLQLITALVLLVCPLLLLFRYRRLQRESSKLIAWAHGFLTIILMLGFICGALSSANWRLTPLIGSCIIATLAYFRELWDDKNLERRLAVIFIVLLVVTAGFHAYTVLKLPNDAGNNQKYITVAQTLAEKGYTKGYATFWNAGNTTLLSDGEVNVVTVTADDNGISKRLYQTRDCWFKDEEGRDNYFLMLTLPEYEQVKKTAYWVKLATTYDLLDEFDCEGFRITVFAGNPIF